MREAFIVFLGVLLLVLGSGIGVFGFVLVREHPMSVGNWGVFVGGNSVIILSFWILRRSVGVTST